MSSFRGDISVSAAFVALLESAGEFFAACAAFLATVLINIEED